MMIRNFAFAALSLMIAGNAFAGILESSGSDIDRYVGAENNGFPLDIIGNVDHFGISNWSASTSANQIQVAISGTYFDNPGKLGADLGDLFLDFNNYAPDLSEDGSLPAGWYGLGDNMFTGTKFGYAIELRDANGNFANDTERRLLNVSQQVRLVKIDTANYASAVRESDYYFGGNPTHRNGQEVRVNDSYFGAGENAVIAGTTGSWINDGNTLTVTLGGDIATLFQASIGNPNGGGDFAFHWGMECGNDVVEGGTSYANNITDVPEPSSIAIFAMGGLGLAFSRRRNNKVA